MREEAKDGLYSNLALEELRKTYRMSGIIGASIIASLFVYLLIVEFIRSRFKPFSGFVAFSEIQGGAR